MKHYTRIYLNTADSNDLCVNSAIQDMIEELKVVCGIRIIFTNKITTNDILLLIGRESCLQWARTNNYLYIAKEIESLKEDAFIVKSVKHNNINIILAVGSNSRGVSYAIFELTHRICVSWKAGNDFLDDLYIKEEPLFKKRGMYAHLHWDYNYPYALRSWSLADWKKYIDILARFRVNFFQIWTMAGICPIPLSKDDEAYLDKYYQITEYAQKVRGMEVAPGEAPNNIAGDVRRLTIEKRFYFDVERLINPQNVKEMSELCRNRKEMYSRISNADAFWAIDNDPGGWKGSPSNEFVNILIRNRNLIDKYSEGKKRTPLIYWMWGSWGTKDAKSNFKNTLRDMINRLPEPWLIHICNDLHLEVAKEMNLLHKAIYFPYAAVEFEPHGPFTHFRYWDIDNALNQVNGYSDKLLGAMCNAQTPLVQLPSINYFHRKLWTGNTIRELPLESIRRLAQFFFPKEYEGLAMAWEALSVDQI